MHHMYLWDRHKFMSYLQDSNNPLDIHNHHQEKLQLGLMNQCYQDKHNLLCKVNMYLSLQLNNNLHHIQDILQQSLHYWGCCFHRNRQDMIFIKMYFNYSKYHFDISDINRKQHMDNRMLLGMFNIYQPQMDNKYLVDNPKLSRNLLDNKYRFCMVQG